MNKYQVKIEDTVSSQSFTFDELLDFGLLDDYDEKIMVRATGESRWVIARNYPFAYTEQNCSSNNGFHINADGTVTRKKKSNATFSSGSPQKGYRIDEYGQVVRTVKHHNREERTDVYQPASSSPETTPSSDDNNCCWWIIVFIIAGIILGAIFG